MTLTKKIVLFLVVIGIFGAIIYLQSTRAKPSSSQTSAQPLSVTNKADKASKFTPAHEITAPSGFINADNTTVQQYIGKKVILIDFWTYSCINCQRTIPYLNAWYEKYKDKGLVIIGVHTPEFDFEKKLDNVQSAVKKFGIKYPVILDNDYGTWNAYSNQYWPREYLIDIDGYIVHDHAGEGGYDETETKIRELLDERAKALGDSASVLKGDMAQPANVINIDFKKVQSPETYFGASRNQYLANGQQNSLGSQTLTIPSQVKPNNLYLGGTWDFQKEFAETKTKSRIVFSYNAKNVYMVASSLKDTNLKILLDGKPLSTQAGADVSKDGSSSVTIQQERLYDLVAGSDYSEHTLEIITDQPGLKAFTFTFG